MIDANIFLSSIILDGSHNGSLTMAMNVTDDVQCSDDFFIINDTCRPRCDRWVTNKGIILEVSVVISQSVGITCGIIFLIVTVYQRKIM